MKQISLLPLTLGFTIFGVVVGGYFYFKPIRGLTSHQALTNRDQQDDRDAEFKRGYAFLKGKGVKIDYQKASYWLLKAANQGSPKAQFELGDNYGKGRGVKIDFKTETKWMKKAALSGDVRAQIILSVKYFLGIKGIGVNRDRRKSKKWFLLAKNQLYIRARNGDTKAQYLLGSLYAGIAQDDKAAYWELKAAKAGNVHAQEFMGAYDLMDVSVKEGIYWMTKAAKNGSVDDQMILSELYRTGKFVPRNVDKADYWIQRALPKIQEKARLGNVTDQFKLMGIYNSLHKCIKSDYWKRKASEGGWPTDLYSSDYVCTP